jgi:dTDP-4-amino-4,6-dideoxygalactose transaminase
MKKASETDIQQIPLVDLVAQYKTMSAEMDEAIGAIIQGGRYIGGDPVTTFGRDFAAYCNSSFCVPCANGTDALEIALSVLRIGSGDEVIIPDFTFVATLEAVVNAGATPVLCDIDPLRFTIDSQAARRLVTPKTKAIVPVHLYGQMADMDALQVLARENKLYLIEDAAQAHGATYKGKRVGSIGDISTFSFFPGKNLGAYGDAGAMVMNDESLYHKAMKMANHGRISKYDHETIGRNSRMDTLQAAVLSVKLNHLADWNTKRNALAVRYRVLLGGVMGLVLPQTFDDGQSANHLFVVRIVNGQRDAFRSHLKENGIETGIHYPIALSKLRVTTDQLNIHAGCPESERAAAEVVSLPLYPELTESEQDYICNKIIDYFK